MNSRTAKASSGPIIQTKLIGGDPTCQELSCLVALCDGYIYAQGEAYWVKGNLILFEITRDPQLRHVANQCVDSIVQARLTDGVWDQTCIRDRGPGMSDLQVTGVTGRFVFSRVVRPGDTQQWVADVTQIQAIGCSRRVSLSDGIARTYGWYRQDISSAGEDRLGRSSRSPVEARESLHEA